MVVAVPGFVDGRFDHGAVVFFQVEVEGLGVFRDVIRQSAVVRRGAFFKLVTAVYVARGEEFGPYIRKGVRKRSSEVYFQTAAS